MITKELLDIIKIYSSSEFENRKKLLDQFINFVMIHSDDYIFYGVIVNGFKAYNYRRLSKPPLYEYMIYNRDGECIWTTNKNY